MGTLIEEQKGLFKTTIYENLQTKTLLFCLGMMKEKIPESVRQILDKIHPLPFVEGLKGMDKKYQSLFAPLEQKSFLEKGTILRIPLKEAFIRQLASKLEIIKEIIKERKNNTFRDSRKA